MLLLVYARRIEFLRKEELPTFWGEDELGTMLSAHRSAGKFAVAENRYAAKIGGFHNAAKFFSEVWRNRMAEMETIRSDDELGVGIENDKVSVIAGRDAAFRARAASKIGGSCGHPESDVIERKTAANGFGVNDRQGNGEAGNAAPRGLEVPFGNAFHFRRAGRMVGDDEVDKAIAKALPKLVAIFAAANRWSAFEERRFIGNGFGVEMQIMRTGFDGYREAVRTRSTQV